MTAGSWNDRRTASDRAARMAALGVFVLAIYMMGYRPASRTDPYHDVTSQLTNTIRASNDGHPFAAYSEREPERLVRIDQYASGHYDPGLPALISATSFVGRAVVGERFQIGRQTIYQVIFGLCILAALVLVCPALPLAVSLGALVALAASILIPVGGQHAFSWPRWWSAYSTLLVAMLLVGLLTARVTPWRPVYFAGLTILASYSRLLREEVVVTACAALAGAFGTMLTVWIVSRWLVPSPSTAAAVSRTLRRSVLVGAVFCLGLAAAPHLLRGMVSIAWGIPFAETTPAAHGNGHSLYLSLGYVPNPYGISWRDNVAMSHSHLIDPTVRVEDPRYQDVLRGEAIRIMLESPWLVRANATRKALDAVRAMGSSPALRYCAVLALLAIAVSVLVLVRSRSPHLLALLGGLFGTGVGACAPAFLIHPGYLYGAQAVVLLLTFVALPAVLSVRQTGSAEQARRVTGRAVMLLALATLVVASSAAGWYAVRTFQYADELAAIAASADPLGDLEHSGYRYARYFNDLSADDQERLIAAMAATTASHVAVPLPPTTANGFRPVLVVYTSGQIHVIAWLGKDQRASALPSGDAYTFVAYCAACEHLREDLPNDPYALEDAHVRLDIAAIHNKSWIDGYRLLSIPVAARPTGVVRLGFQRIAFNRITTFDLATEGVWHAHLQ